MYFSGIMSVEIDTNLFYEAPYPKFESTRSILTRVQQKRALRTKTSSPPATMPSLTRSNSKKDNIISYTMSKRKLSAGSEENKHKVTPKMKKYKLEFGKKENVTPLDSVNHQQATERIKVEEPCSESSSTCRTSEAKSVSPTSSSVTTSSSSPQSFSVPSLGVSEYEMKIQENIQQRLQFLSSLNIEESKKDVLELCPTPKSSAQQERGISKVKKKPSPRSPVALRKSLRLAQRPPEAAAKYDPPPETADTQSFTRPAPGDDLIDYLNEKLNKEGAAEMLEHTKGLTQRAVVQAAGWDAELTKVLSRVSKLRLQEDTVAKAVPQRIMSMAFHPSATDDIVFAGDKSGYLGMWHVDRQDEVDGTWCFRIHGGGINCLSVDTSGSSRVLTTSYDGSTRVTDLEKLAVDEVLSLEPGFSRHYLTWHSQPSPHLLLISSGNGTVTRVDMREAATASAPMPLDDKRSIKIVAGHPVASNYFVSSNSKGEIRLWDLRHVKNSSSFICNFCHPNTASAVRFSPVTGNTLLTTSSDDKIRLLSLKNFSNIEQNWSIRHYNQTGRWLTTLKAEFLPGREDAFIVGSLDQRRVIEVWEAKGGAKPMLLDSELMTTYSSTVTCHPSRYLVAGGNSSGKCYVFR